MRKVVSFFARPYCLLLFSALLSALPLSVPSLFLLSWISYAPFFYVLLKERGEGRWTGALKKGLFFGFFYHFFVYFWFCFLYPLSFAGLSGVTSLLVILLAWLGISFLHGALFAIPTLLCHFLSKKTQNVAFLSFSIIVGILLGQRITELSEIAFPWIKVSLGQYRAPALIQSASLFGAETVDVLILSVCAFLAIAFFRKERARAMSFFLASLIFVSNLLFGLVNLVSKEEEKILVSSVQGCILSGEKWSGAQSALDTYLSLTKEKVGQEVDLVVWPESAVPINLATRPEYLSLYQSLSEEIQAPIFMGCFFKLGGATSNSAVLLEKDSVSKPYSKRFLVPFGERMPYRAIFSTLFPFLEEINMLSSDLAAGEESALMDWNGKKLGAIICFESIFPSLVRESVKDGADLLVLVTNDSWYEDSPAVWQHLAHSVFRSVENHRSTVRCANSGVSAMINEKGQITKELGPLEQGVLEGEVSFSQKTTLYSRVGRILFPIFVFVLFVWFFVLLMVERRRRNV